MKRRIALFPGSFNPMHIGHVAIAKALVESRSFDEVRLLLSPHNPLKTKGVSRISDTDMKRLDELKEAIRRNRLDVTVEDIEFSLPLPHYTFNTLAALEQREPECEFILVMGSDNLAIIDRWYRGREILQKYEVWIYPRKGDDFRSLIEEASPSAKSLKFIDAPLIDISSTQIREAEQTGDKEIQQYKA